MSSSASATRSTGAAMMPNERHHGPPGALTAHSTGTGLSSMGSKTTSGPGRAAAADSTKGVVSSMPERTSRSPDPQQPAQHPHPKRIVEARAQQHALCDEQ